MGHCAGAGGGGEPGGIVAAPDVLMAHFVADVSRLELKRVLNMGVAEFAGWAEYGQRVYPERAARVVS